MRSNNAVATAAVVAQLALTAAAASTACKLVSLNKTISAWRTAYPDSARKDVDVVVVGGGSAGSNAAIHLFDAGLDILLVETKAQLGGMVDSYTNPATGNVFDYGVATYTNLTGTEAYFERLGLSTKSPTFATTVPYYADFTTGKTVDYEAPSTASTFAALGTYYDVALNYSSLFMPSYANWPAADAIPEDLLLPFGEFAAKYELNDTMLLLWAGIGAGLADMLSLPTVFFMQTFGPPTAGVFLGDNVQFVPESGRNQDIYDTVASILGEAAVMVSSQVTESVRLSNNGGVALLVQDQVSGNYTIVTARRLVVAFEPTTSNTAPFDLDDQESAVFNKGNWSIVHTGIVSHPSLPHEAMIYNLPATAVDGNYFAYPEPPFVDYFEYMGDDIYQVIVVGWEGFGVDEAQTLTREALQNLASAGTINATDGVDLTIKGWSVHGPMDMRTSRENLEAGWIQDLYALQGHKSTYWTGAAFSSQLSTYLWYYNSEYLVPLVVDSL